MIKKWQSGVCVLSVLCLAFTLGIARAQERNAAGADITMPSDPGSMVKEELQSDARQIKEQRATLHENAQAAREEERQLKQQMDAAVVSGDYETAKKLRDRLHAMHQENIQQMHQDIQTMQEAKQELRSDIKETRQDNSPGRGPGNPPGTGSVAKDRLEDIRDRREDVRDRREDVRDRRENVRDRREDVRDRRVSPPATVAGQHQGPAVNTPRQHNPAVSKQGGAGRRR